MKGLRVSAIYCYPLKSARGHALDSAVMDAFGLSGDRRWMLVDEHRVFVSQRSHAQLALLGAAPQPAGLRLSFGTSEFQVANPDRHADTLRVTVWNDAVDACRAGEEADAWLSEQLRTPVRLVYLPDNAQRRVDPGYATDGERVAFSDGFPLLVLSQASLDELNRRLESPVPVDRFRPNLVIDGADPHAEDAWRALRIGDSVINLVKPCSRCAVPSIDQQTARRDTAINRVLASYRRREGAIYFGMNALGPEGAAFAVGDSVEVLH